MTTPFPVVPAHALANVPAREAWLIEDLWADQAVGIIGGEPKSFKSFVALDMAVAVAAGRPCLGHFATRRPGRVLLYAAEDAAHVVRRRLDGLARGAGLTLAELDIQVITTASLRLDLAEDRERLRLTVASLCPRLLVLDPFVRLHRVDENVSADVVPLLAYLRALQRELAVAVALVHHSRKGAGNTRAGQALRGSSELHAWGDSNLYLRRAQDNCSLTIEHRAAPSLSGLAFTLDTVSDTFALRICQPQATTSATTGTTTTRVEHVLALAGRPLSAAAVRAASHVRMQTVCAVLADLTARGRITHTADGYAIDPRDPAGHSSPSR